MIWGCDGFRAERRAETSSGERRADAGRRLRFRKAQTICRRARRVSAARFGKNMPSLDCSGLPFDEAARRHRRRRGRDHDRDGKFRPRAGARAVSCERHPRRRAGAARRQRRRAIGDPAENRIRRDAPCLRACRTASALRPRRCRDDGTQGRIACHSRWREDPRPERRQRRPIDRVRAAVRIAPRSSRASGCFWSTRRRRASPGAAILRSTDGARPKSHSPACGLRPMPPLASPATPLP